MDILNLDKTGKDAAKELVDEAAIKLDPELKNAIDYLATALKGILVGRKITVTIE